MSLLLGIYSKIKNINKNDINPVIRDFTSNTKGNHQLFDGGNFILSSITKTELTYKNTYENNKVSKTAFFVGDIYDTDRIISQLCIEKDKIKPKIINYAEIVLVGYEKFGESFFRELNGSFSFVLYDKSNHEIIIGNDSFGSYPLFIYNSDQYLIFCTEYEPIIKYKHFNKRLDFDSITEYYVLGLTLGGKTFFKDINNLNPGSILIAKYNYINIKKYDEWDIKINKIDDINYFAERLSNILFNAIQARLYDPEKIRFSLSGGTDSRLLMGNLTEYQRKVIEFITEASPFLNDDVNQEVVISKMLADKYNLNLIINRNTPYNRMDFGISYFKRTRFKNLDNRNIVMGWGGGEFLGGGCLKSSLEILHVNKDKVLMELNNIFNNRFLNMISAPLLTIKDEYNQLKAENSELLFNIVLYTRPFFSSRFGGSRAGWLEPYKFILRGIPVFWDDNNVLKFLLSVPKKFILDRKLYRALYNNHYFHLLDIPTTRNDLNPIKLGGNPIKAKHQSINNKYSRALKAYLKSHYTFDKDIYNYNYIIKNTENADSLLVKRFIDFEAWYRKYAI